MTIDPNDAPTLSPETAARRAPPPESVFPREPPLHDIWTALRSKWLAIDNPDGVQFAKTGGLKKPRAGGRTNTGLTDFLNAKLGTFHTPQGVSTWATGSDNRKPPWNAIFVLLDDLGLELVISADGNARLTARGRAGRAAK